jgi:magnesium transporter
MTKKKPIEVIIFQDEQIQVLKKLEFNDIHAFQKKNTSMLVFVQDELSSDSSKIFLEKLDIHPIIISDIFSSNQRAKIEMIDDTIFCVLSFVDKNQERLELKSSKMSLIFNHQMVLVVCPKQIQFNVNDFVNQFLIKSTKPQLDKALYYLLQSILNDFYEMMDDSIADLEKIEDYLISAPKNINLKDLYFLCRDFLMLRKILLPIMDISDVLSKFNTSIIKPETKLYFQNMYEQANRTLQSLDFYQHMVSNIHDTYLSSVNNIMNRSIALITKFATIFIPITFITGIYGMNFQVGFYSNPKGFAIVLSAMAALAGLMSWLLRTKKFDIEVQ